MTRIGSWLGIGLALWALMAAGGAWALDTTTPGADGPGWWERWLTLGLALLGSGLGVYNAISNWLSRRVNVIVKPTDRPAVSGRRASFTIEVVNRSAFPITIVDVSFLGSGRDEKLPIRLITTDGSEKFDPRIEARASITFVCWPTQRFVQGTKIGKAYARLASGEIITGSSPALKQLAGEIAKE